MKILDLWPNTAVIVDYSLVSRIIVSGAIQCFYNFQQFPVVTGIRAPKMSYLA